MLNCVVQPCPNLLPLYVGSYLATCKARFGTFVPRDGPSASQERVQSNLPKRVPSYPIQPTSGIPPPLGESVLATQDAQHVANPTLPIGKAITLGRKVLPAPARKQQLTLRRSTRPQNFIGTVLAQLLQAEQAPADLNAVAIPALPALVKPAPKELQVLLVQLLTLRFEVHKAGAGDGAKGQLSSTGAAAAIDLATCHSTQTASTWYTSAVSAKQGDHTHATLQSTYPTHQLGTAELLAKVLQGTDNDTTPVRLELHDWLEGQLQFVREEQANKLYEHLLQLLQRCHHVSANENSVEHLVPQQEQRMEPLAPERVHFMPSNTKVPLELSAPPAAPAVAAYEHVAIGLAADSAVPSTLPTSADVMQLMPTSAQQSAPRPTELAANHLALGAAATAFSSPVETSMPAILDPTSHVLDEARAAPAITVSGMAPTVAIPLPNPVETSLPALLGPTSLIAAQPSAVAVSPRTAVSIHPLQGHLVVTCTARAPALHPMAVTAAAVPTILPTAALAVAPPTAFLPPAVKASATDVVLMAPTYLDGPIAAAAATPLSPLPVPQEQFLTVAVSPASPPAAAMLNNASTPPMKSSTASALPIAVDMSTTNPDMPAAPVITRVAGIPPAIFPAMSAPILVRDVADCQLTWRAQQTAVTKTVVEPSSPKPPSAATRTVKPLPVAAASMDKPVAIDDMDMDAIPIVPIMAVQPIVARAMGDTKAAATAAAAPNQAISEQHTAGTAMSGSAVMAMDAAHDAAHTHAAHESRHSNGRSGSSNSDDDSTYGRSGTGSSTGPASLLAVVGAVLAGWMVWAGKQLLESGDQPAAVLVAAPQADTSHGIASGTTSALDLEDWEEINAAQELHPILQRLHAELEDFNLHEKYLREELAAYRKLRQRNPETLARCKEIEEELERLAGLRDTLQQLNARIIAPPKE